MNDSEIEKTLAQFKLKDAPAAMRTRVLTAAHAAWNEAPQSKSVWAGNIWRWPTCYAAAAALLLLLNGIVPSCAHCAATHEQFHQARIKGLKHLTHFCNQMSLLHHREIGLVGSGLMDDEVMVEAICDKVHLCPDMIKLIFKVKPIDRIAVITDSMLASGLPDGEFNLGGLEVILKDGIVRLKSNGALAGGTIPYCRALKNIFELTGLPLKQLIKTTGYNQARSLGLEKFARIEPGYYADIAILDADFNPVTVFVGGRQR